MNPSKTAHAIWLVLTMALLGAVILWGYLDEHHYFFHVQAAKITSSAWGNHQVKECASWNAKADPPVLECDQGHSELLQVVPVRLYGDSRRELDPDTLRPHWNCQRPDESQPSISCRTVAQP